MKPTFGLVVGLMTGTLLAIPGAAADCPQPQVCYGDQNGDTIPDNASVGPAYVSGVLLWAYTYDSNGDGVANQFYVQYEGPVFGIILQVRDTTGDGIPDEISTS